MILNVVAAEKVNACDRNSYYCNYSYLFVRVFE